MCKKINIQILTNGLTRATYWHFELNVMTSGVGEKKLANHQGSLPYGWEEKDTEQERWHVCPHLAVLYIHIPHIQTLAYSNALIVCQSLLFSLLLYPFIYYIFIYHIHIFFFIIFIHEYYFYKCIVLHSNDKK